MGACSSEEERPDGACLSGEEWANGGGEADGGAVNHPFRATKKGRRNAASLDRPGQAGGSGERWFALTASYEQLVAGLRGKHVFLLLEPRKFGLQVTHAPLQAAHFGDYAGIRPADVAE